MNLKYIMGLAAVFFSPLLWAGSQHTLPHTLITVYTTRAYAIQQSELANKVYFIDAVDNLENALVPTLSSVPDIAERQAKAYLNSPEGKQYQKQLQEAYTGLTEAWKIGVMKVPAIIFDNEKTAPKAIYGEVSVSKAIQLYQASAKE
ncbi:TIGR03757 family integrating conjugative element protein [Pasteurellaceae bacterium LIM206]|nr:TIGR03757 family integrating conjugative element protein [Pasteurellaceae bacterium LIM206]